MIGGLPVLSFVFRGEVLEYPTVHIQATELFEFCLFHTIEIYSLCHSLEAFVMSSAVFLSAEFIRYRSALDAIKAYGKDTGQLFVNPGSQGYFNRNHPLRPLLKFRSLKLRCVHHGIYYV